MFNDSFVVGDFTEGAPSVSWIDYEDMSLWRRIEQYVNWRWGERSVEWVIKGEGLFVPHLKPVTITTVERFSKNGTPILPPGSWVEYTPRRSPFGVELPDGYYRIQGTAGLNEVPPADVLEAYTRLRDYLEAIKEESHIGATTVTDSVPGVSLMVRRPIQAMSRALEYSGAADILKAYRYV